MAGKYADNIWDCLESSAQKAWRMKMETAYHEYKNPFFKNLIAEGKAEGEANALLVILEARKLPVSEEDRRTITSCTDLDQLGEWLRRAVTITDVAQLFD